MKKLILLISFIAFVFYSCRHDNEDITPQTTTGVVLKQKAKVQTAPSGNALTNAALDELVIGTLEEKNDFKWEWMDLKTIWSALQYNDHTLAIGYKTATAGDISKIIHKINVKTGDYKAVHDALINLILTQLNKTAKTPIKLADILVEDDQVMPILTLRITDKEVLTQLANLENVRYLEPLGYWPANVVDKSASGCSGSTNAINVADYTTTTPAALVPWNYSLINVPSAWTLSQGQNITISVIDAGISSSQTLLGTQFTDGLSAGTRTITTDFTTGSSAYTSCAHGTSMCGLAAGPRNTQNSTTGVAYQSSLHFIRACDDVVLDASSEKTGVKNALIKVGNRTDIQIVSMSVGTPFSSSVLLDGVNYAYNNGKLIFAAAGTSYSWTSWWGVIYPAAYSACVAVTGVKENNSTCSDCHDGSQVVFTIPMERNASSSRNTLSLMPSGVNASYIGGSSCATSTTAGIAALVWSARPLMTRDQVMICMKNTAQYYPTKNSSRGFGNVNASAAVAYAIANY